MFLSIYSSLSLMRRCSFVAFCVAFVAVLYGSECILCTDIDVSSLLNQSYLHCVKLNLNVHALINFICVCLVYFIKYKLKNK